MKGSSLHQLNDLIQLSGDGVQGHDDKEEKKRPKYCEILHDLTFRLMLAHLRVLHKFQVKMHLLKPGPMLSSPMDNLIPPAAKGNMGCRCDIDRDVIGHGVFP
jgi:hypothetical protein